MDKTNSNYFGSNLRHRQKYFYCLYITLIICSIRKVASISFSWKNNFIRTSVIYLPFAFIGALSGCATPSSVTPPLSLFEDQKNTFTPLKRSANGTSTVDKLDPYKGYTVAIDAAQKDLPNEAKQRIALNEGMAIIEYRCGEYFDLLGLALQSLSFQRKEVSLIGGLAQGSMGLANQSAKSIANTGALFGFTTSSMDAFQEAFMYTPDIGALKDLTFSALKKNAGFITEAIEGKTLSYGQVMSYLKQYEATCQPGAIRALINQSVNKAYSDNGQVDVATSALQIAAHTSLTSDQVFYLYWLQSGEYVAADNALLTEKLKGIDRIMKSGQADPGLAKTNLSPYFQLFQKSIIDKWNIRITSERPPAKLSAIPAAPAPAPAPASASIQSSDVAAPAVPNSFGSVSNVGKIR